MTTKKIRATATASRLYCMITMRLSCHKVLAVSGRIDVKTKTPETSRLLALSSLMNLQANWILHPRRPPQADCRLASAVASFGSSVDQLPTLCLPSLLGALSLVRSPDCSVSRSFDPARWFDVRLAACSSAEEKIGAVSLCMQLQTM